MDRICKQCIERQVIFRIIEIKTSKKLLNFISFKTKKIPLNTERDYIFRNVSNYI